MPAIPSILAAILIILACRQKDGSIMVGTLCGALLLLTLTGIALDSL